MTPAERTAIIAQLTLKTGYTPSFRLDENGSVIIRVDNVDGWYMEFIRADALAWARAQLAQHE